MGKQFTFYAGILSLLISLSACQKDETLKPQPEQGYPTTYKPLSSVEWDARNKEFQQINIYEGLRLNEYGFVEGMVPINKIDTIEKNFIIGKIDTSVFIYQKFMGIPENAVFDYENQILIDAPYMTPRVRMTIASFYEDKTRFGKEEFWDDMIDGIKFEYFLA